MTEYLTVKEVQEKLKISPRNSYELMKEIPHFKIGQLIRIDPNDFQSWLEKHRRVGV
jgi:excisionase family DNA binding protein